MTTLTSLISGFQSQLSAAGLGGLGATFQTAVNGSLALINQLNTAIAQNAIGSFTLNTAAGATGASYQPPSGANPGSMVFSTSFLQQISNGPTLPPGTSTLGLGTVLANSTNVFMTGHETQHGLNDISFNNGSGTANQPGILAQENANLSTMASAIAAAAPGSSLDVTSYLGNDVTLRLEDEGSANIAGFNANVSAAIQANGGNPLSSAQIALLDKSSGGSQYLFPSGASNAIVQNPDGTITPNAANISAAASIISSVSPSTAPINSFDTYTEQAAAVSLTFAASDASAAGSNVNITVNPSAYGNLGTGSFGQQLSQGQALSNILVNVNAAMLPANPIRISTTDGTTATITRDTVTLSTSDGTTITMLTPDSTIAPYVSPPLVYLVPPGLDDPGNTLAPVQETITSSTTGQQITQYQGVNASAPSIPANGQFYQYNDTNVNATLATGDQATVYGGAGNVLNGSGLSVSAISGTAGINLTAVGNNDTFNSTVSAGSGSSIAFGFSGGGEVANVSAGSVYLNSNGSSVTINGSGDSANAFNGATGLVVALNGSSDTANLGFDTINLTANAQSDVVNGSSDTIGAQAGAGSSGATTVNGSSDQVNATSNNGITINGNSDTIGSSATGGVTVGFSGTGETANLNSDAVYFNSAGSSVAINGSHDNAYQQAGATSGTLTLNGSSDTANLGFDTINLTANAQSDVVNGSSDTIGVQAGAGSSGATTINGSSDMIAATSNNGVTINGNSDTISSAATGGILVGFSGTSETANLTNDGIFFNSSGSSITVNGSGDTANSQPGATGLVVGFAGYNDTANLSNDTIYLNNSSTSVNANGSGDTINASSGGAVTLTGSDTINGNSVNAALASGSSDTISGNADTVYANSGTTVGIWGQGSDSLSSTGKSTFNIYSGTNDSFGDANGANDIINMANSTGIAVSSAYGEYINAGSADKIAILTSGVTSNNQGVDINASNSSLSFFGAGVDLSGGSDNIVVTGGQFGLISGTADNISGGGGGVTLMAGTQASFTGTGFHIGLDGNNGSVSLSNTSTQAFGGSPDIIGSTGQLSGEVISGSNLVIDIGSNEALKITGSNDVVHGGVGDTITASGTYDSVYATGSTVNYSGSNTGDVVNGNGDTGSDWGGGTPNDSQPDGNYTGYGAYDGYAFSSQPNAKGTDIGVLASYDASLHDQSDAIAAQTARLQAVTASGSTVTPASFASQFEGPKWASSTITWSLATSAGSAGTPYSGFLGSQYDAKVEQAFQVWAAASGLKFQEVADSASSDIRVGWSTLSTQSSSVLGYTSIHGLNGQIQAGVDISLENPNDVALVKDSSGQLAYSGTQAEFSQLLIHEIGHALGLADDSDPNSVMNAVLTSTNRTLDATDLAGIKALYSGASGVGLIGGAQPQATGGAGPSANPVTVPMTSALGSFSAQAEALISAMASFSPTTSSSPFVVPPTLGSTLTSAAAINVTQPGH